MIWILCVLCPPLAIIVKGKPGAALLNCFLTLFFWVPGIIHALIVVGQANADHRTDKLVGAMKEQTAKNAEIAQVTQEKK